MDLNHTNHQRDGGEGDNGGVLDDYSFDQVESNGESGREEVRGVNNGGDRVNVWYDTDL